VAVHGDLPARSPWTETAVWRGAAVHGDHGSARRTIVHSGAVRDHGRFGVSRSPMTPMCPWSWLRRPASGGHRTRV